MHKFLNKKNKILLVSLTLLITLFCLFLYLEYSYQSCKPRLAQNFINGMKSFSCYQLKKSVSAIQTNPYGNYSNVFEIDRSKMGNNNGIACNDIAFIAKDLPKHAKNYVAFHEFLHTQDNASETSINIKAGIKKPLGMLQTITYSMQTTIFTKGLNKCSMGGMWKAFKVYFLGDTFEDLIVY